MSVVGKIAVVDRLSRRGFVIDHRRVVVGLPHLERVAAERVGDLVDDALHPDHALWPAEAAKRRRRLGVGLEPVALDPDVGQVVGVVGVQHRAVGDRQAQVLRPAAAHVVQHVEPEDAPGLVEARAVADAQVVALAGDDEIVVAVVAHATGTAGRARRHGAGDGERVALALLAPEAAAHPAHLDPDCRHRRIQRLGHLVLDLGRMLRRGMDEHAVVILRQRQGGLSLQVEVLLTADLDLAVDGARAAGEGGGGVALDVDPRPVLEPAVGGERLLDRQDGFERLDLDPPLSRGAPRRQMAGGDDEIDRLAEVEHVVDRQERLVMRRGADVIGVRQITRRQHRDHTRRVAHAVEVEARDPATRHVGQTEAEVQRPGGRGNVVDVARGAGDVQRGGVMGQGARNAHAVTFSTSVAIPSDSAW